MKNITIIASIIFFAACRPQLPFTDLSETQKKALPEIINIVRRDVGRTPNIVIIYKNFNHPPAGTRDFAAIIFNRNTGKKYFFLNNDMREYRIHRVDKTEEFSTLDYILDYYLDGKENYLKSIQQMPMSGGTYPAEIFDIDFLKNNSRQLSFNSIYLDKNGQPEVVVPYKGPKR